MGIEHQEAERLAAQLETFARSIREATKPPQRGVFLHKAKLGYTVCVDGLGLGRNFHTGKPFGAAARNIDDTVTLGISTREPAKD